MMRKVGVITVINGYKEPSINKYLFQEKFIQLEKITLPSIDGGKVKWIP